MITMHAGRSIPPQAKKQPPAKGMAGGCKLQELGYQVLKRKCSTSPSLTI